MKTFVIYDTITGDIRGSGCCQDENLAGQAIDPTDAVMEVSGHVPPDDFRVDLDTLEIVPK